MIAEVVNLLGPWTWVVFGLLLLGIEILLPSTFLLWPGLAAIVVGIMTLVIGLGSPIWPWQAQVLVFLLLSLVIAFYGRALMKRQKWDESESTNLNERGLQLVGRTAVVVQPIVDGEGRIRLGDTTWRVYGADAKAGARVKVVSADGSILNVEPL